jgi:hypothetical protein
MSSGERGLFTVAARRFGRYLRRASVERRLVARLCIDVPHAGPEARHDLTRGEAGALGQQHTHAGHAHEHPTRDVAQQQETDAAQLGTYCVRPRVGGSGQRAGRQHEAQRGPRLGTA